MNPLLINAINLASEECHANATRHGFHDLNEGPGQFLARTVSNIHAEVSELWEAYRNNKLYDPCDKAEKMTEPLTCAEEELADIIIRVFDTAERLGINIGRAISVKHEYNIGREYMHGGKAA